MWLGCKVPALHETLYRKLRKHIKFQVNKFTNNIAFLIQKQFKQLMQILQSKFLWIRKIVTKRNVLWFSHVMSKKAQYFSSQESVCIFP